MSPPCQPFTRLGLKKDLKDNRCSSLSHILELIPQLTELKNILVENVQGFETSEARNEMVSTLEKSEFNFKEFLLSPCQFGIPNSRQRYYLIAKKKGLPFVFSDNSLEKCFSEKTLEYVPKSHHRLLSEVENILDSRNSRVCYPLKHVIENNVDSRYLLPEKVLKKRAQILDIRMPSSTGTCCFTKAYSHYIEGTGSVFSPCSGAEILETFEYIGKVKEISDENMERLNKLGLRYFTPKEVSRLMCFPEDFKFPEKMTDKQKYRLLGNSINVHVVSMLIYLLNCENMEC